MSTLSKERGLYNEIFEAERHAKAVEVLDLVREYLDDIRVKRSLGSFSDELMVVANIAEVPGISNGYLQCLPDYQLRTVFPFAVVERGETIYNPMTSFAPVQSGIYREWMATYYPNEECETLSFNPQKYTLPDSVDGATHGSMDVREDGLEGLVYASRPFVCVRPMSLENMALTTIHEFAHAHRLLIQPVSDKTAEELSLESEIVAYPASHRTALAISNGKRWHDIISARVEGARWLNNGSYYGKKAFKVDDKLRGELTELGLRHIWQS